LQMRHTEPVNGSVQAMAFVQGETDRYLVIGVNDEVLLYRIARKDHTFQLVLISKIAKGTIITDIKVNGSTIYVGDIMRQVFVLDFIETWPRQGVHLVKL